MNLELRYFNYEEFKQRFPIPEDQLQMILQKCIDDLPGQLTELEQGISTGDRGVIKNLSHALKGVALSVSGAAFAEIAHQIEAGAEKKREERTAKIRRQPNFTTSDKQFIINGSQIPFA